MKIYLDLFITGFTLGWGPCLLLCAPVLLPFIAGTQKGWRDGLKLSVTFALARIIPYIILSVISASIGQYIIERFYQTKEALIIEYASGVLIVLLGLMVLSGKSIPLHWCKPVQRQGGKQGIKEIAVLGLVVGAAPCLPLFGVLTYIGVNAHNVVQGALLGLVFGLGTLISPLLLAGSFAGWLPGALARKPLVAKIFSRLCGIALVYLGVGVLVRAISAFQ